MVRGSFSTHLLGMNTRDTNLGRIVQSKAVGLTVVGVGLDEDGPTVVVGTAVVLKIGGK